MNERVCDRARGMIVNFGDILDKWEREKPPVSQIHDKDAETENVSRNSAEYRRYLHSKKPDAVLDIHGLSRDEAWLSLENFFDMAKASGFEKLRIIHGKGNHSTDEAILGRTVRDFIERCSNAGESGYEKAAAGGTGATWVLLKQ